MKKERLIVIGDVAAGMSAASRARRLRPDMEYGYLKGAGTYPIQIVGCHSSLHHHWKSVRNIRSGRCVSIDFEKAMEKRPGASCKRIACP